MQTIVQLQKHLEHVPDNTLIGYVQNPTGQVPSYLALTELQRRKDMRAQAQQAQAPKQTVAQTMIQEAHPHPQMQQGLGAMQQVPQQAQPMPEEQGVANLPTGDMFQPQSFATGGIVAFDDGGRVSHHERIDPMMLPPTDAEQKALQLAAARYMAGMDVGTDKFNIGADMAGMVNKQGVTDPTLQALYANYVTDEGNRYGARYNPDAHQASLERISKAGNRLGLDVAPDRIGISGQYNFAQGGEVPSFAGPDGSYVSAPSQSFWDKLKFGFSSPEDIRKANVGEGLPGNPFMGYMPNVSNDPMASQMLLKQLYEQLNVPGADKNAIYQQINEVEKNIRNPYTVGGYQPTPQDLAPPAPPAPAPKPAVNGVATDNAYDKLLGKERSLKDLSDEYMSILGEDKGAKKAADRLAKLDQKAEEQEKQAPWLALAKAGFEMANTRAEYGKAANALGDIARGAGAGLKDYADSKEALNKLEEKRFLLENELAKQARAEQIAALKYGQDSKQHTEEMNKSVQIAKLHDKTQRDIANMENNTKLIGALQKGAWDKKDYSKRYDEVSDSDMYKDREKAFLDSKGAPAKDSPAFKVWKDMTIKDLIRQTEGPSATNSDQWTNFTAH